MGIAPNRHQFTVEDYHFLAEQGKFKPDSRLELIEGEIFELSPIGSLHARCVKFFNIFFSQRSAGKFIVSIQDPIFLNDLNEPEPDVAILHYQDDLYKDAHPTAEDTLIVIEVSDTSLFLDRNMKFPRYAKSGIPEAWLIDIQNERVEIHSEPGNNGYGKVQTFQRGEEFSSVTMPDIKFSVNDVLG